MVTNKTVAQKAARRKMNMLELAEELGNLQKRTLTNKSRNFYESHSYYLFKEVIIEV